MKIQYCSDLHLEFLENKRYVDKHKLKPEGELLLLAGDILPFELDHADYSFFDFVSDNFEAVYWIPGNHEYYGSDIGKLSSPLMEKIRSNVFLVNNQVVIYKNINIICSTMWSKISALTGWMIERSLSDFSAILFNGSGFTSNEFNSIHEVALSFIKNAVKASATAQTILLTHHVPTFLNYPPKYLKSPLSEAFAVELHNYIESSNISAWIYGHHHCNIPLFKIGDTDMLTNQLGYVRQFEHRDYRRDAVFEI